MANRSLDDLRLRRAIVADIPTLEALIERSAAALSRGFYTDVETRAAIEHVFGVDSELIDDGTYLIAEDEGGKLLGCGGWSRRTTLFGGDRFAGRVSATLDPATDAARIRAFFVAPEAARRGVASALLAACEAAAQDAGFDRLALMATLPGVPFYTRHGFAAGHAVVHRLGETMVTFVPMTKSV